MAAPDRVTVQFVALGLQPDLVSRTPEGVNPNGVARRDLERYYQVLSDELARLALTEDEATVLVAALNGTIHGVHPRTRVWIETRARVWAATWTAVDISDSRRTAARDSARRTGGSGS